MEREISLREIIDVLLKQKWIIVIVTLISIFIAAVYSLFVSKDTYETYSIVNIQSTSEEAVNGSNNIKLWAERLKSSSTLDALIEKNKLDRSVYSIAVLNSMINIQATPENNLIKISVTNEDAERTSVVANLLAFELGTVIEVSDRSRIIGISESRLIELTEEIAIAKSELTEAQKQLKNIDEFQVAKQVVTDNELLRSLLQEKTNSNVKTSAVFEMESQLSNPAYTNMQTMVAESAIALDSLLTEQNTLKEKVDLNKTRINEIMDESFVDKITTNTTVRINDGTNMIVITPSIKPEIPVGSNTIMNVILATILGFIISLLIAFVRQYWKSTPRSGVNA
jgi:Capsular polysaccharide biosynthesis protein